MDIKYEKMILPKPYMSWSQLTMWLKSPDRYRKEYFESTAKLDTKYLRFGSAFANMVEDLGRLMENIPNRAAAIQELSREYPMSEGMREVLMELDINGISEYQIGNSMRAGDSTPVCKVGGIVPCFSFLDIYKPQLNVIREYKTGKAPWTRAKVLKHDQLLFYAVMLIATGKPMPEYCDLDWIETRETQSESQDFWREGSKILDVTGRIISFRREFDEREIERMETTIIKVAWEISDAYQDFLMEL